MIQACARLMTIRAIKPNPSLQAAYDYYPFGMLMPGRYAHDTTQQCAWVNQTKLVPKWLHVPIWAHWACSVAVCGFVPVEGMVVGIQDDGTPDATLLLESTSSGTYASNTLEVSDGNDEDILVEVINLQGEFLISIEEQVGEDEWNALSSVNVNSPQNYHLTFVGTGRPTRIRVVNKTAEEELGRIVLRNIRRWRLVYEPENVLVQVCNTAKDRYRFGWNTHEKVNEIAGIGNHTTALFGEFDTRLGRRWNPDPKPIPEESLYAVNRNSPIRYNDPNGDCPTCETGAVLAAFTEYASIVGSKMLFDGMNFSEANGDLGWRDALDITIAPGAGAVSGAIDGGITKWTAWISKPTNQKIAARILEVSFAALESSLKQVYKDEDFDLKSVLAGAFAEVGMGNLLKTDVFKEASERAGKSATVSAKKAEDLGKRKNPNNRLVEKTKTKAKSEKKTAKAFENLDNSGKALKGTAAKTIANEVQDKTKTEEKR